MQHITLRGNMKQTENITAKAETTQSINDKYDNAKGKFDYNLIQQKVRIGNNKDAFYINASALLPAVQDLDSTREAKVKPTEYTENYLNWLVSELVQANGIKEACTRILNKCVMIQFNQAVKKLLCDEYEKALIENPSKAVSKSDLEHTINNSELVSFYNDKHTFPESERTDSMLSSTKRKVDKANKQRVESGLPSWNDEEIASKVTAFYAIELSKQAEQNELLS